MLDLISDKDGKILPENMWDLGSLFAVPVTYPAEDFKTQIKNIRSLYYQGLPYNGKQTRVFAWYGAPDVRPGEKLPAIVLVHGGGGTAFDTWVDLWVKRGFAAIAMDLCGCVPRSISDKWVRNNYGGPLGWGGFDQIAWPRQDQWVYHAIADVILANSLLRSFPEVDADRIGMTGISWGGYLSCIAAGIDNRFRFAAPVYGCGFLGDNSSWLNDFKNMGEENSSKWLKWWDPSVYLKYVKMPMLWVTGTNDTAFPMDSLQKSYRVSPATRTLCVRVRMEHGHGPAGENPEEIHAFAKSIISDGRPLAQITGQGRDNRKAWVDFSPGSGIVRAELNYTKDKGAWEQRFWDTVPAELDMARNRAAAEIPEGAKVYYINLISEKDLIVSSEHKELG